MAVHGEEEILMFHQIRGPTLLCFSERPNGSLSRIRQVRLVLTVLIERFVVGEALSMIIDDAFGLVSQFTSTKFNGYRVQWTIYLSTYDIYDI